MENKSTEPSSEWKEAIIRWPYVDNLDAEVGRQHRRTAFVLGVEWQREQDKDLLDATEMLLKLCKAALGGSSYKNADETIAFAEKAISKTLNQ